MPIDPKVLEQIGVDPDKPIVEQLVGEGKKYSSIDSFAKSWLEANSFVEQLKLENREFREELDKRMTVEDLLANKTKEPETTKQPDTVIDTPLETQTKPTESVSKDETLNDIKGEEDLGSLVRQAVAEQKAAEAAEQNLNVVAERLRKEFGEKALEFIQEKASELGVTPDFLEDAAKRSPEAYFRIIGLENKEKPVNASGVRGNINTAALEASNSMNSEPDTLNPKTDRDFKAILREDPNRYFSPEIQNLRFKARVEKGEDFWS